ncbi:MAG TPA: 2,5-diamino-6-(ribosylamino)-4(3H)-pyrimidinone 5'-phosphate reductase [Candidatus Methanoperedenaceae archaeon]|nr:2,5-diamino-6-(ribosylamino)-4(3H)-pyrimidinone 5'-phosphate reductase [Candidatus Methanoperedenaceae archaeon]
MRPHVILNAAMSADGKIATYKRRQLRISGSEDFRRVDALRAGADAVMVGIGTVLADNPSLTVKSEELRRERVAAGRDENPVRIVVDSSARTPPGADLLRKGTGKRIIAVVKSAPSERIAALRGLAEIIVCGEKQVEPALLLGKLWEHGIRILMVEGGGTLNWALFSGDLVDEVFTFVGNIIIGGASAPTLADGSGFPEDGLKRLELQSVERMDEGVLLKWKVIRQENR